jgi:prolipoprotein diacylglyceryltransferase
VLPELGPTARHPLQLYAATFDLVLAGLLTRAAGRPGTLAAGAAVGFGAGRLVLEQLRDPAAMDPPLAGLWTAPTGAALALSVGMIALVRLRRR